MANEDTDNTLKENYESAAKKLLDFSALNPLLYFRFDKKHLTITYPDMESLFSSLTKGEKLSFFDINAYLKKKAGGRRLKEEETNQYLNNLFSFPTKYCKENEILASNEDRRSTSFTTLYRTTKESIEDRGVNILYLAFGFLHWTDESDPHSEEITSPLLLLPLSMKPCPGGGYEVQAGSLGEEDPVLNGTLSYKLELTYHLELPVYQQGEDLFRYLERVKSAIAPRKDFSIELSCSLGLFSFANLVMYQDLLRNEEKALSNPLIVSLLTSEGIKKDERKEENSLFQEENLHCVVDADSSQMKAIEASVNSDESFVLVGPPGTGKSQTITNIIAENLAAGKKVLFVSEKIAALNVVYHKLEQANLDDFCFELHSNNLRKEKVIAEINRVLSLHPTSLTKEAERTTRRYQEDKEKLDAYAKELNAPLPVLGQTPYEVMEEAERVKGISPLKDYYLDNIRSLDRDYLEEAEKTLKDYQHQVEVLGLDYEDDLMFSFSGSYEYEPYLAFTKEEEKIKNELPLYEKRAYRFTNVSLPIDKVPLEKVEPLLSSFSLLRSVSRYSPLFIITNRKKASSLLKQYHQREEEINPLICELSKKLKREGLSSPILKNREKGFALTYANPLSRLKKEYRVFKKEATPLFYNSKDLSYESLVPLFTTLHTYWEKEDDLNKKKQEILSLLPPYEGEEDFKTLEKDIEILDKTSLDAESYLSSLTGEEFLLIHNFPEEDFSSDLVKEFLTFRNTYFEPIDFDNEDFLGFEDDIKDLEEEKKDGENYHRLTRDLAEAKEKGYLGFITTYISKVKSKERKLEDIVLTFHSQFYSQWAKAALQDHPILTEFTSASHDALIKEFASLDEEKMKINQSEIREKLFSDFPHSYGEANGEVSRLRQECQKKRNILSVRGLLERYGNLIEQFKPCFLMSPLSVSTYLSQDMHFDLVVFDEASQVFPWEAIGALYRGNRAIISGDEMQMPPTSFFLTSFEEEEKAEEDRYASSMTDFESILTAFSAFPHVALRWHYRSKSEELIRFSNHYYYGGNLVTFPSAQLKREGFGVDFCYVPGVYDRTHRTNEAEASKIAELVYHDCYLKRRDKSVGIIAFNTSQQELIQDKIDEMAEKDQDFAAYLAGDYQRDPLFVKNLETCQGDERDIIYFSICFAPDRNGRFLLSFGPLSQAGGERRLNVAITRAKENLVVVSSIHYTDLDPDRMESVGGKRLREYLRFAENDTLEEERKNIESDALSSFNEEIASFLKEHGIAFDTMVGTSSHRIDIAVKNKEGDHYILALEGDSSDYGSNPSTRERERLRPEVLRSKGWSFLRIYSPAFYLNPEAEEERILEKIEELTSGKEEDSSSNSPFGVGEDGVFFEDAPFTPQEEKKEEHQAEEYEGEAYTSCDNNDSASSPLEEVDIFAKPVSKEEKKEPSFVYEVENGGEIEKSLKSLFPKYETVHEEKVVPPDLLNYLAKTIEVEQPIKASLLEKRVMEQMKAGRMSEKIRSTTESALTYLLANPSFGVIENEGNYFSMRRALKKIELRLGERDIEDIPEVEIIAGFVTLLQNEYSLSEEALYRDFLSLFDTNRLTEKARTALNMIFQDALKQGKIKKKDELLYIAGN